MLIIKIPSRQHLQSLLIFNLFKFRESSLLPKSDDNKRSAECHVEKKMATTAAGTRQRKSSWEPGIETTIKLNNNLMNGGIALHVDSKHAKQESKGNSSNISSPHSKLNSATRPHGNLLEIPDNLSVSPEGLSPPFGKQALCPGSPFPPADEASKLSGKLSPLPFKPSTSLSKSALLSLPNQTSTPSGKKQTPLSAKSNPPPPQKTEAPDKVILVSQAEPEAGLPVLMSDLVFAEIEATILSRPEAARAIDAIFLFAVKQEGQLAKRFGNTCIIFVHPV
jgi:hypothetical protein